MFSVLGESWGDFLNDYAKGDKDLSNTERPGCAMAHGFMIAPPAHNESKRAAAAKTYIHRRQWRDTGFFDRLLIPILHDYQLNGVSVSIINREFQLVKYEHGISEDQISRNVAIDAHALLSRSMFCLLNAPQDWRMIYNPFVHGPPFIKFYGAVRLVNHAGITIGVLAVFDPQDRPSVPDQLQMRLEAAAGKIMELLDSQPSILSPRIETASSEEDDKPNSPLGFTSFNQERFTGLIPSKCGLKNDMNTLRRLNRPQAITESFAIAKELRTCLSSRGASEKASKILAQTLGMDFVYVVEVRVTRVFEVSKTLIPFLQHQTMEIEKLGQGVDYKVNTRLLGGTGVSEEEEFNPDVHMHALSSKYGIQYDAPDEKLSFRSGIFMPFRRSELELVKCEDAEITALPESLRYSTIKNDDLQKIVNGENEIFERFSKLSIQPQELSQPLKSEEPLRIKIRNGGFVMAAFTTQHRTFSPNDVEYMKNCVRALDGLFA